MIAPVTASERDLRTLSGIVSDDRAVVTHEGFCGPSPGGG